MKNTIKFFGIIVLIVVIGFSFVSCGDNGPSVPNTDGRLTITGLKGYISGSKGIYAYVDFYGEEMLIAAASLIAYSDSYDPVGVILNGGVGSHSENLDEDSVTLKVWVWTGESMEPYSENGKNKAFEINGVWNIEDNGGGSYSYSTADGTVTVDFVNGVGTGKFIRR